MRKLSKRHRKKEFKWLEFLFVLLGLFLFSEPILATENQCRDYLEVTKYYILMGDRPNAEQTLSVLRSDSSPCQIKKVDRTIASLSDLTDTLPKPTTPLTFTAGPYFAYDSFGSGAAKSSSNIEGIYLNASSYPNLFEIAVDHVGINLVSGAPSLHQYDFVGTYTRNLNENWSIKVGGTSYTSTDGPNMSGYVYSLGLKYAKYPYELGIDNHLSYYPTISSASLMAIQTTPYASFSIGNTSVRLTGFFIYPIGTLDSATATAFGGNSLLKSGQIDVSYLLSPFVLAISGFTGNQIFPVKQGGFIVYNTLEDHTHGLGASLGFQASQSTFIKVGYTYEWIQNSQISANYKSGTVVAFGTINF